MNPASDSRQLGDYRLKELLSENPLTRTWLAEQVSISRLVLVDELRDDQTDRKQEFLADVRAKAAVDHPLIGSVFEAAAGPDVCFFAHERLDGVTLAERSPLLPGKLAHLLRRVAEAQLQLEALDHATSPLGLESIHLDEQGVIRLENLAIAGSRAPGQSVRDIVHLGSALVPLLAAGRPGATRLLTLLSWMRGEGLEAPISWAQTRDYCLQIEHQLADPPSLQGPGATRPGHAKKRPVMFLTLATLMMLVVILVLAFQLRPPEPKAPPRAC